MVQVLYGKRGSGKTKRIIEESIQKLLASRGYVVFVEKDNRSMLDLPHAMRYVNAGEFGVMDPERFYGFVAGMLAANFDITDLFIDAMPSIAGLKSAAEAEKLFNKIAQLTTAQNVNLFVSMGCAEDEEMPEYLKPFVV